MSAIPMSGVVEHYDRRMAIRHLEAGNVVIFSLEQEILFYD